MEFTFGVGDVTKVTGRTDHIETTSEFGFGSELHESFTRVQIVGHILKSSVGGEREKGT